MSCRNRENQRKYDQQYYQDHKDKRRAYTQQFRDENPEYNQKYNQDLDTPINLELIGVLTLPTTKAGGFAYLTKP